MVEIQTSKEYLFSLWLKLLIVLSVFWGIVYLILSLLESINLRIELSPGQSNSVVISTLLIITFVITGLGAFLFYSLVLKRKKITINDDSISFKEGLVFLHEKKIPYSELKDAHCDADNLEFIDNLFKISILTIHGVDTIHIEGVRDAEQIAKEIKIKIDASKEKKVDPISLLVEDIKNIKNEISELKSSIQSLKTSRLESEKEAKKSKKKFVLGPVDEEF